MESINEAKCFGFSTMQIKSKNNPCQQFCRDKNVHTDNCGAPAETEAIRARNAMTESFMVIFKLYLLDEQKMKIQESNRFENL
jgi:hypothetical protein